MRILVLLVGAISIVGTSQIVMGSDGGNINGSIIACVYGACKDNSFSGGSSSGGGGGQPTPTTGTLTVTKEVHRAPGTFCPDVNTFKIHVESNNPSPANFDASTIGTEVTLGPGQYSISESAAVQGFKPSLTGNCAQSDPDIPIAIGNMNAGGKQTCSILNDNGVQ